MQAYFPSRFLLCFVALVLIVAPLAAQDRAGQLETLEGSVTIIRAKDGSIDAARKVGTRVRNGSVFPNDIVRTSEESTAKLVFSDGSKVEMAPDTQLTVEEVDRSALLAAGKVDKPVGRMIRVLAGDALATVIPNPQIATMFQTPSGVAAVKGTVLRVSVPPGKIKAPEQTLPEAPEAPAVVDGTAGL